MIDRREPEHDSGDDLFDQGDRLDDAVKLGAFLALQRHKALNQPIVIWHNGGPISLPAAQIDAGSRPNTLGSMDV